MNPLSTRLLLTFTVLAALVAGCSAPSGDGDAEQAIGELVQSLEDAANVRDWGAFFSNFTDGADLVVFESPRAEGRAAARALMEAGWSNLPTDIRGDLTLRSVRLLGTDVAIADIDAVFSGSLPSRDRATAVVTRRDGAWLIDAFRIMQPEPVSGSDPAAAATTVAGRIRNALSAAPAYIADEAAVWDWPAGGQTEPRSLREGSNGWTCFPTQAEFAADSPICMDEAYLQVQLAELRGEEPTLDRVGLRYMLRGAPSVDDQGRRTLGAHVMIAVPLDGAAVQDIGQAHRPRGPYVFPRGDFSVVVMPVEP